MDIGADPHDTIDRAADRVSRLTEEHLRQIDERLRTPAGAQAGLLEVPHCRHRRRRCRSGGSEKSDVYEHNIRIFKHTFNPYSAFRTSRRKDPTP